MIDRNYGGRLQRLASFSTADFTGRLVPPRQLPDGSFEIVGGPASEATQRFVEIAQEDWTKGGFDWIEWKNTPEGHRLLHEPSAISEASEDQLEMIITTLVRSDRFTDGTLAEAIRLGTIGQICERAIALMRRATGRDAQPRLRRE